MSSPSFRTEIRLKSPDWKIDHQDQIFGIGSCFTDNIQLKLSESGFSVFSNPAGIVYNPISLLQQINQSLTGEFWKVESLIHHNGLFHGLHHHGSFSSQDKIQALDKMNMRLKDAHVHLQKSNVLLITLGSAIVYEHKASENLVANCHKLPANNFNRRFLEKSEIINSFAHTLALIHSVNPDLKIIITVSPVRYLKEGFSDNSYSKAILINAVRDLINQYDHIQYFPAYEMMLDDLRDYRFYKEDMVHPNDQAIEYIWSKFTETYFEKDTISIIKEVNGIHQARQHRPLYPDTKEHELFLKNLEIKTEDLKRKYPFVRL